MSETKKISIKLSKDEDNIKELVVGCSWGSMKEDIDIDTFVFAFNNKNLVDTIYYNNKTNKYIKHFGDDLTGNKKQHESDNEVIYVSFEKAPKEINRLVVYIDSFKGQELKKVPNLKIRLYTGKPGEPNEILCSFVADDLKSNAKGLISGEFVKINEEWTFNSIQESFTTNRINSASDNVKSYVEKIYLKEMVGDASKVIKEVKKEVFETSISIGSKIANFFKKL